MIMKKIKTQVCVLGAGAGGTGCVYRLIKNGIKTVVVDKNPDFGGTAVFCGVDGWEPGVTLDGLHLLLKDELEKMENGCHVVEVVPNMNFFDPSVGIDWSKHSFEDRPFGFSMATGCTYEDTFKRCTSIRGVHGPYRRFQFEPDCMRKAINNVFAPYTESLTSFFGHTYKSCVTENGKIKSITITNVDGIVTEIFADYFVDSSGGIALAIDAGCDHTIGTEGKEEYNEPSAALKKDSINGVTYVFRIAKASNPEHIDEIPSEAQNTDVGSWSPNTVISAMVKYPNGDVNINMLPTLQGKEYLDYGNRADEVGRARVYKYWRYLQTERNFMGYTLKHIFNAGIRESYRLKGKYVLKEQDLRAGILKQPKIGRTIAIADHMMDVHGENGLAKELEIPYEIPLECSMTKEFSNLFVACRGASFSHIAASSARLTRTMLSMGEGVGEYLTEQIKAVVPY